MPSQALESPLVEVLAAQDEFFALATNADAPPSPPTPTRQVLQFNLRVIHPVRALVGRDSQGGLGPTCNSREPNNALTADHFPFLFRSVRFV